MTLLTPWWLFLGLAAPLVYFLMPAYRESESAVRVSFFQKVLDTTGKSAQKNSCIPLRSKVQKISLLITWGLLVLCAAQPVILGDKITEQKSARDLMVALDLSKSMNKIDFSQQDGQLSSRWGALQKLMWKFGAERQGDRLGLIVFGSGAYLQVPFTQELETWTQVVEGLETEIAGPATAIGDAIGLSIRAFDKSDAKQKVLILVTDGSDTSSQLPPVEAAKVAKTRDIKIYTIAMGNPDTKDENAKVDVNTLRQVAALTGGKNYLAMNKDALKSVLQQINQIEQSKYQQSSFQPYIYLYPYLLTSLLTYYAVMWLGLSVVEWRTRSSHG
ncbi:VWA domain-containing protein [Vibrio mediterranei]|uniref:VWFA domain-containing protein n=1 Tax=Vibrio mediterranei TaxID=689 RepID=A0AAN1KP84_9VIBR|nr:VWA domain-containing protein [Vibrio mediterranei]ASI91200.1 hypothetical protein BSZ05_16080 [Vibrio mediterranei]